MVDVYKHTRGYRFLVLYYQNVFYKYIPQEKHRNEKERRCSEKLF